MNLPFQADVARGWLADWLRRVGLWVWEDHKSEFFYAVAAVVWSLIRAMGKTVESGQTGLKFSFGKAVGPVEPGFHPLVPFLQVIRVVPTRSRTLDLAAQRVVTDEGLVIDVDANLVYRVVDVRRALIEVDDLVRAMEQVLALSVQELLRPRRRTELYASPELDLELSRRMAVRLEAWGVQVEHAGFPSLRPSAETLRITQLSRLGSERSAALGRMRAAGVGARAALALASEAPRLVPRTRPLAQRDRARRAERRRAWIISEAAREAVARIASRRAREGVFTRHARLERARKQAEKARWE